MDNIDAHMLPQDRLLYQKLYISRNDLSTAAFCCDRIIKMRWHHEPWSKRGTVYQQQTVFTTALIVSYGRVFTKSDGLPWLPRRLVRYNKDEKEFHARLLTLRDEVYAHSDAAHHMVRPVAMPGLKTAIVRSPTHRLTEAEAIMFRGMVSQLIESLNIRMDELHTSLA